MRFALRMVQMFGAVFALVLILETSLNKLSLAATVLTCAATSFECAAGAAVPPVR